MEKIQNSKKLTALITVLAMIIFTSGCSVVGLGVGAVIDSGTPDYKTVETDRVESIKRKTKTVVHLNDGSQRAGKFINLVTKPVPEAANRYADSSAISIEEAIVLQFDIISDDLTKSEKSLWIYSEYIDLSDVTSVQVHRAKYCKWIGLAIGLVIDVINLEKAISNFTIDFNFEGVEL
jgi:hypothetical protein